ncbi:sensor domain-containing protein [Mycobacterium sp. 852002-40037_SCH5390672]|uniref:sensor domain-containing protein n=1 Tax=Mycobacterium sp. 852002-40037_SCH5390672 TaxID=1834089 RepID=UPI0009ED8B8F|nr:sensor domain-containing protein [Mycobacterium sp. 852002-40037_SCH5390672]
MTASWPGPNWPNPFDPGAPPPPPPGQPPARPPSDDVNPLATLSVVFAFLLAPVGVVLGHFALADIRRRGDRGRNRALVGLTLSYAFTVIAVVALVLWATLGNNRAGQSTAHSGGTTAGGAAKPSAPASAPPEPSVTAEGLQSLVLTGEDVAGLIKAPGMYVNKTWTQTHELQPGDSFDPPQCTEAVFNGLTASYRDSGYRAIYGVDLGQHTNGFPHGVSEFVATFDNAAAAKSFVTSAVNQVNSCAGKQLTYSHGGVSGIYSVGTPVQTGPVTSVRSTLGTVQDNGRTTDVGSQHTSALRALAAKANVVVDVDVIGRDLGDDATTVVQGILGRIPS